MTPHCKSCLWYYTVTDDPPKCQFREHPIEQEWQHQRMALKKHGCKWHEAKLTSKEVDTVLNGLNVKLGGHGK